MQVTEFRALRSKRFVVTIESAGTAYKVLQVLFLDREGGLFVALPYFKYSQGLLGHYVVAASPDGTTQINLRVGGKTTSRRVKYSHHVDGEAHFSEDKQVYTVVRKSAVPLTDIDGHLFTVQLQSIADFKPTTRRDEYPPNPERTVLTYRLDQYGGNTIKFVGRLYSRQQANQLVASPESTGPRISLAKPDGTFANGFLLASPAGSSTDDYLLLLTCEVVDQILNDGNPYLLFFGGFDDKAIVLDRSKNTSAIFLIYAQREEDFSELTRQLGSIDFTTGG